MHVFVTGGTGLIGSAVVAELIGNGHTVLALVRSDASARAAEAAGAETLRGSLADLDTVRAGAARADGVVHLAFSNDFSSAEAVARSVAEETAALTALGEELLGSDRPLVTVSGTPWVAGRVSTEEDPLPTDGPVGGRGRTVMAILDLATRGVRSTAIRLPRTVHNDGDGGFAGLLTAMARQSGVSGYPGDGLQRWPAVHALDAAVLFRLALEKRPGRVLLARRGRRGRRRARHRRGHRSAARAAGAVAAGGELRPARRDLRDRPAVVERPHPGRPRVGADAPEPARRTWRTSGPDLRPG